MSLTPMTHPPPHHHSPAHVSRALIAATAGLLLAASIATTAGCGPVEEARERVKKVRDRFRPTPRACLEHEECFGGEHCDRGTCQPYEGATRTEPAPDYDDSPYRYDLGTSPDFD